MAVSYLGIEISGLTYVALLLLGLIIFIIILIATENKRQRQRHFSRLNKEENSKLKAFI
jgi:NADH:ubiquinone oxidoreductase subunit 4 (subunit M)